DFYLIKTTATGDTQWTRTFGGSGYEYANSVAQTSDGGYIIAGYTESFGAGGADVYLVKTDSLGYTAIDESPSARPEDIAISAYPNPFNSSVVITIADVGAGLAPAKIEIYDLKGNIVGSRPASTAGDVGVAPTSVIWTPNESVGSGVYFIVAKIGSESVKKRIVYLK
ncbi:T9SS type A sorting domain-containing protein, partial [bacterium]|nr:T9SS type A sorting domain-containing protein [bacterium]